MNRNGLLIWIVSGAGVLFLYSAIKNVTPQSVILAQLNGTGRVAISDDGPAPAKSTTSTIIGTATGTITGTLNSDEKKPLSDPYLKSPATKIDVNHDGNPFNDE